MRDARDEQRQAVVSAIDDDRLTCESGHSDRFMYHNYFAPMLGRAGEGRPTSGDLPPRGGAGWR